MRVVAIIQARMGSTRLPGKVLMDIAGETMLARVVNRVRGTTRIDEMVVATTLSEKDELIASECRKLEVACFRGSEDDVLDRYYQAALAYKAKVVVRITSDCPLLDPEVLCRVIQEFLRENSDYASNSLERTYPRGLDTEVMTVEALARAWREASKPYQRAHVTPYIYHNSGLFRVLSVKAESDYSQHRWTVDTPEDLAFVREIYNRLGSNLSFGWQEVLKLLNREPGLKNLNRHILQKSIQEG